MPGKPLYSVPVLIQGVSCYETRPVTVICTGKTGASCGILLLSRHVVGLRLYYLLRHRGLGCSGSTWIICLLPLQAGCAGKRGRALHTVMPVALLRVAQQGCDACERDPP